MVDTDYSTTNAQVTKRVRDLLPRSTSIIEAFREITNHDHPGSRRTGDCDCRQVRREARPMRARLVNYHCLLETRVHTKDRTT